MGIDGVTFTISYAADGGDAVVLTAPVTNPVATSTALYSSANPTTVGQPLTFTAYVTPASGTANPTGSVIFTVDGQDEPAAALAVVGGVDEATFTISSLAAGPHTIAASYGGDATFAPSQAATPLMQTVSARPSRPP